MTNLLNKLNTIYLSTESHSIFVLHLPTTDQQPLENYLADVMEKSPKLFSELALVLDFGSIKTTIVDNQLTEIIKFFMEQNISISGIRGASYLEQLAADVGTRYIPKRGKMKKIATVDKPVATKIVRSPVRSGQQIYAKNSDLIVLSSVGHGAEVIADGNIHIYGDLKGKAIAGAAGNSESSIFCQQMQAELISIAGNYRVDEDLMNEYWGSRVHISLVNNSLVFDYLPN